MEVSSPHGMLLALDADPTALSAARERLAIFGSRALFVETYFDRLAPVAVETRFSPVDGVLFDLGVSSPQLDTAGRGFSFQRDAPLDMRFGPSAPRTAADLVSTMSADDLQWILQEYGEERHARRVARSIVAARRLNPIRTTGELAQIVVSAKPAGHRERIHPATRVFQALRIAVNDELERLRRALPQAVDVMKAGGRVAAISFHSLEDRIVKQFFQREAKGCICPPGIPVCVCGRLPTLRLITKGAIEASPAEVTQNPRARSARLRVAEKLAS